ncbi:g9945 [Coccomyxa viridis]|uniref:G9945 protein n=1 Tax=Coccomyxa viridis TaxID=1274662 RepID=A0ABP1G5J1_9CHLO
MVKKRRLSPKSVWDEADLTEAFIEEGIKEYHVQKLHRYLLLHPDDTWHGAPELPKAAVALLDKDFTLSTSTVEQQQVSSDGTTTKLLVRLQDGMQVEAVVMTYTKGGDGESEDGHAVLGQQRSTLCVSSQVGCQMGCTFCATGTMGLKGDLTAGEIVEQLVHAQRVTTIKNVVYMGMGEPLNNYEQVRTATRSMINPTLFGLKRSKVTISTVGIIPRILQLSEDLPGVSLALSLHAPNQELRQSIVPSARAYKLDKLMAAVDKYEQSSRQKIFVEYVMLHKINDSPETAHELGQLLRGRNMIVNLIPWNPVYSPSMQLEAPGSERVADFQRIVREQYGIFCTVRQEMGQDISGACGQLVVEQTQGGCGGGALSQKQADIEELGKGMRRLTTAVA